MGAIFLPEIIICLPNRGIRCGERRSRVAPDPSGHSSRILVTRVIKNISTSCFVRNNYCYYSCYYYYCCYRTIDESDFYPFCSLLGSKGYNLLIGNLRQGKLFGIREELYRDKGGKLVGIILKKRKKLIRLSFYLLNRLYEFCIEEEIRRSI